MQNIRYLSLAACFQLVNPFLKIGFAEKSGTEGAGGARLLYAHA